MASISGMVQNSIYKASKDRRYALSEYELEIIQHARVFNRLLNTFIDKNQSIQKV